MQPSRRVCLLIRLLFLRPWPVLKHGAALLQAQWGAHQDQQHMGSMPGHAAYPPPDAVSMPSGWGVPPAHMQAPPTGTPSLGSLCPIPLLLTSLLMPCIAGQGNEHMHCWHCLVDVRRRFQRCVVCLFCTSIAVALGVEALGGADVTRQDNKELQ